MKNKKLDARGKGEFSYDKENDIIFFKIKDRNYFKSLEFDELVVDLDSKDFIIGLRIFEASRLLKIDKDRIESLHKFEFNAKVEAGLVKIQLRFILDNPELNYMQDFVREILDTEINDSEVLCTI